VSVRAAWTFAIALSFVGLAILLYFNQFAILVGVASLALIAFYPFMKRITWWPQAWLGLTFNWGVPFGYAAMTGTIAPAALLFYAGCFFWTIGYDTIYAHQDKEDDILIGVKSSAIRLGARSKPWLYVFYALAFALMIAGGLAVGLRVVFVLSMVVAGAHLLWQLRSLDIDRPLRCLMLFKSNRDTGALIAAALILGSVFGV
jgi:4-hydroxybenzoate polyprenyltransferase